MKAAVMRLLNSSYVLPAIAFLLIVVVWEVAVYLFQIPSFLLPAPHTVFIKMVSMRNMLLSGAGITLFEALAGFGLGCGLAILAGITFAQSRIIERSLYPYVIALKSIPIVALAPLLIIWLGSGLTPKIVLVALVCFFPCVVNTVKGLRSVDEEWLDLMRCLAASPWQILWEVRWRFALPYIFSALKISSTFSVIGAVVSEFVIVRNGLGSLILLSSYRLETEQMFAGIVVASLISVTFFGMVSLIESKVLFWHESEVEV